MDLFFAEKKKLISSATFNCILWNDCISVIDDQYLLDESNEKKMQFPFVNLDFAFFAIGIKLFLSFSFSVVFHLE